jgi:2-iminobutanoate/2-iminopropanoate deaminase
MRRKMSDTKIDVIDTKRAPRPGGHYSQAIRAGEMVFAAGQVARDPATGELIPGDIETQTRQVLRNLQEVLETAGSSLGRIVKTTVFLRHWKDWKRFNKVYTEFFPGTPPARTTVVVKPPPPSFYGAAALVEIDAIALAGDSRRGKKRRK